MEGCKAASQRDWGCVCVCERERERERGGRGRRYIAETKLIFSKGMEWAKHQKQFNCD